MVACTEDGASPINKRSSAFPLVKVRRTLGGRACPGGVAGRAQHDRQRQACVTMIDQGIGALSEGDRRLGDESSRVVLTTPGQQLCSKCSPGNRCLECMTGKSLALRAQIVGLVVPVEREARAAQQR